MSRGDPRAPGDEPTEAARSSRSRRAVPQVLRGFCTGAADWLAPQLLAVGAAALVLVVAGLAAPDATHRTHGTTISRGP